MNSVPKWLVAIVVLALAAAAWWLLIAILIPNLKIQGIWTVYLAIILGFISIWVLLSLLKGDFFNPWDLITDQNQSPSTSQFQATIWTIVVIAALIAVIALKIQLSVSEFLAYLQTVDIPGNLLTLAGLGYATWVASSGITQAKLENSYRIRNNLAPNTPVSAKITKAAPPGAPGAQLPKTARALVNDDSNNTDLGKYQLVTMTVIVAVIFWIGMHMSLSLALSGGANTIKDFKFPDLSPTLLALAGVSQGAYIANKGINDKPQAG